MSGANPGWKLKDTPTADEWNDWWKGKLDWTAALASLAALNANSPSYADDTEAAAGGVAVGEFYLNYNFLMMRRA